VAFALLAVLSTTVLPVAAAPAPARALFHLSDPRLDEASGIAQGIRSPGVLYVQNDSGDSARFFALDARTGKTLAVYDVPGATNHDWEDIAVAPDSRGVPSVWISDAGDNDYNRSEVQIYRVDEPRVDPRGTGATLQTSKPDEWRLNYPDGPQNVESLMVAPGGQMYLANKVILGDTTVFSVPLQPDADAVRTVTQIGYFQTRETNTVGGPNALGQLTVTGGALSPSGNLLVLRTYTDAYLWRVGAGGVAAALTRAPVVTPLPAQPQGEGITFDGNRLLTDSEKVGSTVWSVAIPDLPGLPTPSRSASAPSTPVSSSAASTPAATATAGPADGSRTYVVVLVVTGLVALAGLVFGLYRRAQAKA
jgi:hypothetical protein